MEQIELCQFNCFLTNGSASFNMLWNKNKGTNSREKDRTAPFVSQRNE